MKTKYILVFFSALLLIVVLLTAGYQLSYRFAVDRQAARSGESVPNTESISAEGEAVKENSLSESEGFYICELYGFVAVYLADRTTIYEMTEIPVSELPSDVAEEIQEGKFVADEGTLYAFLENYSS